MRTIVFGALAMGLWLPRTASAQRQSPLRMEQVMSAQEMTATGVAKLTPAQRLALEQWLDRYTSLVTRVAQRSGGGGSMAGMSDASAGSGGRGEPIAQTVPPVAPTEVVIRQDGLPQSHSIRSNINGGAFIALDDGTMWEIAPGDRPRTVVWRVGSDVLVRRTSTPTDGFEYLLIGSDGRAGAAARFRGRTTEHGKVELQEP
jgi:hypothetical protein